MATLDGTTGVHILSHDLLYQMYQDIFSPMILIAVMGIPYMCHSKTPGSDPSRLSLIASFIQLDVAIVLLLTLE